MGNSEGFVDVPGGKVWYRIAGAGPGAPLLVLHGGPGSGHDYLEPLAALADGRPVVFYDQLGCGKSEIPEDDSLWQLPRFVEEVAAIRRGLALDRVHVIGHSWGGWLAIEYMLSRPEGVVSLTLGSTSASCDAFLRSARRLVDELPEATRETILRCERDGATDSPEFTAATFEFYMKHLCRIQPWPDCMMRSGMNTQLSPTYKQMWGPSEFTLKGNLAGWDRTARLKEITAPTLVTVGRFDEGGVDSAEELRDGIPGAQLVVFEESSHTSHIEEPERFEATLRDFLRRAEAAAVV